MRATLCFASVLALLLAGCFSPTYHNGNLNCTAAGECPEGYHCAVDHTCWRNGSEPDVPSTVPDTAGPENTVAPERGVDTPDAASDGELPTDLLSQSDAVKDLILDQNAPETPDAADTPAMDVPAAVDGPNAGPGEAGGAGDPRRRSRGSSGNLGREGHRR